MSYKGLWRICLGVVVALAWTTASRADSLNLTMTDANQSVVQGTTTVEFDASVVNPSTTDTIYLNGDDLATSSPLVSIDDSPYGAWPLSLAPGDSFGPAALFFVDLPADLAPGEYTGTFSITGGADGGTFDDLADANFTIDVTGSSVVTPEPGTWLLLCAGLLALFGLRRSRGRFAD
jgi:hypothetical protein